MDKEKELIFNKVKAIIHEQLGVDEDSITLNSSFLEDLAADSIDIVDLVMNIEETFGIEIPEEDAEKIQTVNDVVEYIMEAQAAK